jgi:Flp pilus assembly pilin Flp
MNRQANPKRTRFLADDRGGEVIEYALVLGLVIVVAIVAVGAIGTKVVARWTSVNSSLKP